MNVKALAAVVGTLSLASLATGCASTKAAQADKGADQSTGAQAACAEADCGVNAKANKDAAATTDKAAAGEGGCSAQSCNNK